MIPAGTDLDFHAFPEFVKARAQVIQQRLITQVGSEVAEATTEVELPDEDFDLD